ncbi:unnamed protein product [Cuscuta epithymum]|uniref:NAC domain-containing protein n=1 Tax=Cuscuta epithymum TaxID=186058 RepID=A0AAV0EFX6_9ASTE|nr:unnamed protein product [Cuscuta epithymum]
MEKLCGRFGVEDPMQEMDLPPGFRFHPTDEELITHYLSYKVLDSSFSAIAIAEVDMNKVEPWDLPWEARIGEKEWYFFCVRDKKYPTGMRTNRATTAGYWKATGKDKEIFRGKCLVGMKKTLVFYMGRAPKGLKTNWVSHEYRLEGEFSVHNLNKVAATKNDWVICRVFQKSSGGKKVHISGMTRCNPPPLTDSSPSNGKPGTAAAESESGGYVHCFSNNSMMIKQEEEDNMMMAFNTSSFPGSYFPATFPAPDSLPMQDPAVLRSWLASYGQQQGFKTEKEMVLMSSVLSHEMIGVGNDDNNNTEITGVVSNLGKGERCLEHREAPPSTTPLPQVFDSIWTY